MLLSHGRPAVQYGSMSALKLAATSGLLLFSPGARKESYAGTQRAGIAVIAGLAIAAPSIQLYTNHLLAPASLHMDTPLKPTRTRFSAKATATQGSSSGEGGAFINAIIALSMCSMVSFSTAAMVLGRGSSSSSAGEQDADSHDIPSANEGQANGSGGDAAAPGGAPYAPLGSENGSSAIPGRFGQGEAGGSPPPPPPPTETASSSDDGGNGFNFGWRFFLACLALSAVIQWLTAYFGINADGADQTDSVSIADITTGQANSDSAWDNNPSTALRIRFSTRHTMAEIKSLGSRYGKAVVKALISLMVPLSALVNLCLYRWDDVETVIEGAKQMWLIIVVMVAQQGTGNMLDESPIETPGTDSEPTAAILDLVLDPVNNKQEVPGHELAAEVVVPDAIEEAVVVTSAAATGTTSPTHSAPSSATSEFIATILANLDPIPVSAKQEAPAQLLDAIEETTVVASTAAIVSPTPPSSIPATVPSMGEEVTREPILRSKAIPDQPPIEPSPPVPTTAAPSTPRTFPTTILEEEWTPHRRRGISASRWAVQR